VWRGENTRRKNVQDRGAKDNVERTRGTDETAITLAQHGGRVQISDALFSAQDGFRRVAFGRDSPPEAPTNLHVTNK
jgi:hypothetical protein